MNRRAWKKKEGLAISSEWREELDENIRNADEEIMNSHRRQQRIKEE